MNNCNGYKIRKVLIITLIMLIGLLTLACYPPLWLLSLLTWALALPAVFVWIALLLMLFFISLQRIKKADLAAEVLIINYQAAPVADIHLLQKLSYYFEAGNESKLHGYLKALYLKRYCNQHQISSRDGLKQLLQDQAIAKDLKQALAFAVKPNWQQTLSFGHWPINTQPYLRHAQIILTALCRHQSNQS
ncbi:hypothetical protein K6Y31_16295 [Motilimonas cestriensis]|uniref:DUF4129 domain-containing protein n=1 Tax=Motilimonas cestriensis TaxID=2742685 RepID=A0ABS8WG79_9GAMM|nr:hypothetical protein [Motilimonas cestriensis]MCE2596360.1 hypothetical protein [Motilimonas cestriensis]